MRGVSDNYPTWFFSLRSSDSKAADTVELNSLMHKLEFFLHVPVS